MGHHVGSGHRVGAASYSAVTSGVSLGRLPKLDVAGSNRSAYGRADLVGMPTLNVLSAFGWRGADWDAVGRGLPRFAAFRRIASRKFSRNRGSGSLNPKPSPLPGGATPSPIATSVSQTAG
jgi:hypothetical protein